MITDKSITIFIESLGHNAACPTIDCKYILSEWRLGKCEFDFHVNKNNLCWYTNKEWKEFNPSLKTFKVHIREIKLSEIGI